MKNEPELNNNKPKVSKMLKPTLSSFNLAYKVAVEELAKSKSSKRFNNSGPVHAGIIMTNLYNNSETIILYANNLNGVISSYYEYADALESFINDDNKKLYVIVDDYPNPESKAYQLIIEGTKNANDRVFIYQASESFKKDVSKQYNRGTHFAVGDNNKFRLEYDPIGHQALCSFNDKEGTAKSLIELFDRHFQTT